MSNKFKNILGNKYGRLTVIKSNGKKNGVYYWVCQCVCGNLKEYRTGNLESGSTNSCGCYRREIKQAHLIGQRFGRLIVISRLEKTINEKVIWICKCDCDSEINVDTNSLTSGNTKSCGCLQRDIACNYIKKAQEKSKIFTQEESAARIPFSFYKESGLSFEDFLLLSKQTCHYCGVPPQNTQQHKRKSDVKPYVFIYSGLDRINSKIGHIKDNIVPCCKICNRAKNSDSYEFFIKYLNNLAKSKFKDIKVFKNTMNDIHVNSLNKKYLKSTINSVYVNNGYNDSNLTLEQFYKLSQLKCYYCDTDPYRKINMSNKSEGEFIYNGLDRINSNLRHSFENVITCCRTCNFAKNNLSIDEFFIWINRIKNHLDIIKKEG